MYSTAAAQRCETSSPAGPGTIALAVNPGVHAGLFGGTAWARRFTLHPNPLAGQRFSLTHVAERFSIGGREGFAGSAEPEGQRELTGKVGKMSRSLVASILCALAASWAAAAFPNVAMAQAAKGKDKPIAPEDVKLESRDGWSIHATYYAGKLKKQAVPFIMLHGWEGQRSDYDDLALYMQSLGHAVICPDLRGHGQSNTRPGATAKAIESPDDLTNNEVKATFHDVEACKKFLRGKNNAGELNIEMLTVIGADYSCITALQWSAADWSVRNLPSYKQGEDVKLVILLTPWQSYKGNTLNEVLTHPAVKNRLGIVLIAGRQDSKGYADAKKLNTRLENFRPEMKKDEVKNEDRTLFLFELDTNLSGTKLLNEALKVKFGIANVVKFRLTDKQEDFAWTERKNPLGD